ncbi:MAG: hypothetical protein ABIA04_01175 [Pseudomonadota bacterium]
MKTLNYLLAGLAMILVFQIFDRVDLFSKNEQVSVNEYYPVLGSGL